jgi:hypothetical protein
MCLKYYTDEIVIMAQIANHQVRFLPTSAITAAVNGRANFIFIALSFATLGLDFAL